MQALNPHECFRLLLPVTVNHVLEPGRGRGLPGSRVFPVSRESVGGGITECDVQGLQEAKRKC